MRRWPRGDLYLPASVSVAVILVVLAKIVAYNVSVVIRQAELHGLNPGPLDFIPGHRGLDWTPSEGATA